MSKGIILSKEHGVNPSVQKCTICGDGIGLILFGRLKGDKEAPREVHHDICDKCRELIKGGGVALIEVRDDDSEYRTGNLWFLKREAVNRIFPDYDLDKKKVLMIPVRVAGMIGLPNIEKEDPKKGEQSGKN